MSKPATHDIGVYGAHLHVAATRKQLASVRRQFDLDRPDAIGMTWLTVDTHANNAPHLTVWVDFAALDDGAELVDIIAHEAVHAAALLLDHIGQEAGKHDSEALAYLTGWVAARVWEAS